MKIGLVGKPNVGKSTFYAAATLAEAEIGNYPFTTIEANRGMAYVRVPDPGQELGVTSTPRTGKVVDGTRYVPVEVVDVAGLVPGAHEGRGLGNRFLSDLARADVLIHVVDAAGATDAEGNPVDPGSHDPLEDVRFLEEEVDAWIEGLLRDGWEKLVRRVQQEGRKMEVALVERLSGLGVTEAQAVRAIKEAGLAGKAPADYPESAPGDLARAVRRHSKPIVVALNKSDQADPEGLERLEAAIEGPTVRVAAQAELALGKADQSGAVRYAPGSDRFEPLVELSDAQRKGLEYIQHKVLDRYGQTGVHAALECAAFDILGLIPAFPVEDESHLTDKDGRVLPDCHLVPLGTTAKGLAYRVHTDLGEHFVRGIDCRTKRAVGADHELEPGSVIKIAADA